MRHLTHDQALAALRRGKEVEQLLEAAPHGGRATVRWLSVFRSGDAFVVHVHHVYDRCDPDTRDLSFFEPVNEDEDTGEGTEVARELEPEHALAAARRHGAAPERWVNQGVVADEYADLHGWR